MPDRIGDNFLLAFRAMIEAVAGRQMKILLSRQGSPPVSSLRLPNKPSMRTKLVGAVIAIRAATLPRVITPRCKS